MNATDFLRCIAVLLVLAGLLAAGPSPAWAQDTGSLAGVIVDGETGDPLPGANVTIQGTTTGTATDLNGRYTIPNLDPGAYDVVFSFIGFQQKTVTGVEVQAGQATKLDITLNPQSEQLDEVIVTAEAARDSEAGLLKKRQKAAAVSDAISAEAISQAGAGNAAAAMRKVTGASVVGGKYVYVRGLGDRYTSTQLNGSDLPTSDPDRKSVQFDLFPSDLLDNIVTLKTFTPDKPGDFSGGLVDINTKSFPENFSLKVSTSVSVNPTVHFDDEFLAAPGGGWDWTGFDDGTRSLPSFLSGLSASDIPNKVEARLNYQDGDPELANQLDQASKAFNNNLGPITGSAPLNQSLSFSLGNQQDVLGRALGYVVSLTYDRSASFYDAGQTGRFSVQGGTLAPELIVSDTKGTQATSLGGIFNLSYKLTPNHQISINNLYTHDGESEARMQMGRWPDEISQDDPRVLVNRALFWTERDLYSGQLKGQHLFSALGSSVVNWDASYSITQQEQPDLRFFVNLYNPVDETYTVSNSNFNDPARLFRDLTEEKYSASLDYDLPFTLSERKGKIKLGGSFETTTRDFQERFYSFDTSGRRDGFSGDEEAFFASENMGITSVDGNRPEFGIVVDDQTKDDNNYDGDRTIAAGYLMTEVPVTERLKLITGARLETTDLQVQSRSGLEGSLTETDILPSLNVVYSFRDDMNFRLAGTRTLARPTFREIAPFVSFDFFLDNFLIGNPELERSLIDNLDLRWEWFTRPSELFAASIFFKRLQDPIERSIVGGTNGQTKYVNVDEALVYGAEFEARMQLNRISEALQYFSFGGNLSLIQSRIDIPAGELEERRAVFGEDASATRTLQGQSPYTMNADLSYENPGWGTSAALSFNLFGERLSRVTRGGTPDVFESSRPDLNLTFSQRIFGTWRVKASASNLLDSDYKEVYTFNNEEFPYQTYREGRSFSLGLTYNPN